MREMGIWEQRFWWLIVLVFGFLGITAKTVVEWLGSSPFLLTNIYFVQYGSLAFVFFGEFMILYGRKGWGNRTNSPTTISFYESDSLGL